MSDFLPILLGEAQSDLNRNDNVNPDNFPTSVTRNYNVRRTNIPNSNVSLQNFQDATLGKKIAKRFDRDFRTLLATPKAIKRWRAPRESDLLGTKIEKFPSFAYFLAHGKSLSKTLGRLSNNILGSKITNSNVNTTKPILDTVQNDTSALDFPKGELLPKELESTNVDDNFDEDSLDSHSVNNENTEPEESVILEDFETEIPDLLLSDYDSNILDQTFMGFNQENANEIKEILMQYGPAVMHFIDYLCITTEGQQVLTFANIKIEKTPTEGQIFVYDQETTENLVDFFEITVGDTTKQRLRKLTTSGNFETFLNFSNSVMNLDDKWDINFMPHIKYLIARYNFWADSNGFEAIFLRHSTLENTASLVDAKYSESFPDYFRLILSEYEKIQTQMYHVTASHTIQQSAIKHLYGGLVKLENAYNTQLEYLYRVLSILVPVKQRRLPSFKKLYNSFLPNISYKYVSFSENTAVFVELLYQMLLERNHFPEYTQRDYSYLNILWQEQEYNIFLLNHIIYQYPIGKTLQLISCIVFYFMQLAVSKYGEANINNIKFSDAIQEIHSNLSPIALENGEMNTTLIQDLALYMQELEDVTKEFPAIEYEQVESDISEIDQEEYPELEYEKVESDISDGAQDKIDNEETIDFYNEDSLGDYAKALEDIQFLESPSEAIEYVETEPDTGPENVPTNAVEARKNRLFRIILDEDMQPESYAVSIPDRSYENINEEIAPTSVLQNITGISSKPNMLEAPPLVKMLEPPPRNLEIEAPKVLKTIENMPELQMLEDNYGRPLAIEDFETKQILHKPSPAMIEFPPEQRIAVNQPSYQNNEQPYVTFPLDEGAYDTEMDLLLRDPFTEFEKSIEMEQEQPAITYPGEAEMTEQEVVFKPAEMSEQVYLRSIPAPQQRLRILPKPTVTSKFAIVPRRSKRLIEKYRKNRNMNMNIQNLDLKQIKNTDLTNLRKQELPNIRELAAIAPPPVMKQIKAPPSRLAIEPAVITPLAIENNTERQLQRFVDNLGINLALVRRNTHMKPERIDINTIIDDQNYPRRIAAPVKRLAIKNTETGIAPRRTKSQQIVALPKRRRPKQKYIVTFPPEQQSISNLINRYNPPKEKRVSRQRIPISESSETNNQLIEAEAARRWKEQIDLLNVNGGKN